MREFILGNNQTGLVTNSSGTPNVVGGENATLAGTVHPGQLGIFVGSGSTESTYTAPTATIAAWNSFFATVTASSYSVLPSSSASSAATGGALGVRGSWAGVVAAFSVVAAGLVLG